MAYFTLWFQLWPQLCDDTLFFSEMCHVIPGTTHYNQLYLHPKTNKQKLFQYLQETIFFQLPQFSKEMMFLLIHVFANLPSTVGAPFWNNRIHSGIVVSRGSELLFPHHLQLVMGVIAKPNNIYGICLEYSVGPHLWQKSNFNGFFVFFCGSYFLLWPGWLWQLHTARRTIRHVNWW